MFARAQGCLPNGSFIGFTVTDDHEDTVGSLFEESIEGEANSNGKPMTKAPRGGLYSRYFTVLRMATEDAVRFAEFPQFVFREEALIGQHGVQRKTAVALT